MRPSNVFSSLSLSIALVVVCPILSYSQANFWQQVNSPHVYQGNFISVLAHPNGNLFAGTFGYPNSAGIFRSTNNGESWNYVGLANQIIQCLAVDSAGNMYAGTRDFGIARSTDQGSNWYVIYPNSRDYINSIATNSNGHILATVQSGMWRSTNNGESWTAINPGIPNDILALAIGRNGQVFAGTWGSGVFESTNDGNSWVQVSNGLLNSDTSRYIASLGVNASGQIFAGVGDFPYGSSNLYGGIFRSTDDGANWFKVDSGWNTQGVLGIGFNSAGHVFAGTRSAGILKSTNNGGSWQQVSTTNSLDLAVNSLDYVVSVNFSGIFRSTDGGDQWAQMNSSGYIANVQVLLANSTGDLFASSSFPAQPSGNGVYRSTTGSQSWNKVFGGGSAITNLDISPSQYVYAAQYYDMGDGGYTRLYRSTDNGYTWTFILQVSARYGRISSLATGSENVVLVGTSNLQLLKSTNNGNTWFEFGLQHVTVGPIAVNSSGHTFAAMSSDLWRYNDSIQGWTRLNTGFSAFNLRTLRIKPLNNHIFAGTVDGLFRSIDNGDSWSSVSQLHGSSLSFTSIGHIYLGTSDSGMYRSTDDGLSWVQINAGLTTMNINSITSTYDGFVYSATPLGIFRSAQSTPVEEQLKELPSSFMLRQNYPNPFNPTTKIKFHIPADQFVSLKVFDILGREAAILVNEQLRLGNYEVRLDADNFSSGIYFYEFRAGGFVDTKKMLLLR